MSDGTAEYRAWLAKADEDWLCVRNEMAERICGAIRERLPA